MGYKKLDEVMELLTDELDGFNKSIIRLEKLTQNVENIKVMPDNSEILSWFHWPDWFRRYSCGFITRFGSFLWLS